MLKLCFLMSDEVISFIALKFLLKKQYLLQVSQAVTQYHYTEWYDKNVPTAAGLLSFRSRVKQKTTTSNAPKIVHCRYW